MIFDVVNRIWKSNFGTFWHLFSLHHTNSQNSTISFGYVDLVKHISNFVSPDLNLHNQYCHIVCCGLHKSNICRASLHSNTGYYAKWKEPDKQVYHYFLGFTILPDIFMFHKLNERKRKLASTVDIILDKNCLQLPRVHHLVTF